jgi:uncharacterized protein (UPF0262 family)
MDSSSRSIHALTLDDHTIRYHNPVIQQEREMAIADLLRENSFILKNVSIAEPYHLHLSAVENRLILELRQVDAPQEQTTPIRLIIGLQPFRRVIKDYFMIWESYGEAIRSGTPERLEAIDMGRRALHNEAAELLTRQLETGATLDFDTARRLFTLLCVLHIK